MPTSFGPLGVQRDSMSRTTRSIRLMPFWPVTPVPEIVLGRGCGRLRVAMNRPENQDLRLWRHEGTRTVLGVQAHPRTSHCVGSASVAPASQGQDLGRTLTEA